MSGDPVPSSRAPAQGKALPATRLGHRPSWQGRGPASAQTAPQARRWGSKDLKTGASLPPPSLPLCWAPAWGTVQKCGAPPASTCTRMGEARLSCHQTAGLREPLPMQHRHGLNSRTFWEEPAPCTGTGPSPPCLPHPCRPQRRGQPYPSPAGPGPKAASPPLSCTAHDRAPRPAGEGRGAPSLAPGPQTPHGS